MWERSRSFHILVRAMKCTLDAIGLADNRRYNTTVANAQCLHWILHTQVLWKARRGLDVAATTAWVTLLRRCASRWELCIPINTCRVYPRTYKIETVARWIMFSNTNSPALHVLQSSSSVAPQLFPAGDANPYLCVHSAMPAHKQSASVMEPCPVDCAWSVAVSVSIAR